ncbi:pore-forming ESAT-6 family protein [Paraclostridium bifermentans]|jgi:WXG100 family type VII secretion target|uniref:pore-forming ESAT-6 family protein n=1 Tax=Paraclostridium bifermentans TaxID=1490 RepID=UPI00189C8D94|nr:pore-forming ESAT-6 family protein [Paraclostridium bifermentans]
MSVEGINITLEQVHNTAGRIKTLNSQLAVRLEEIKKEINALDSTWKSEASTTIRANFNKLAPRFEEYKKIVDSYGTFLESTVEAYTKTEATINNNASAFA